MLAKAIAKESHATFVNVSLSSIMVRAISAHSRFIHNLQSLPATSFLPKLLH
jgi:ATP-dependent 26S proteasome regulatory subunit